MGSGVFLYISDKFIIWET